MEGFLNRKESSYGRKVWKSKWFELDKSTLKVYDDLDLISGQPVNERGTYYLIGSKCEIINEKKLQFSIKFQDNTELTLQAPNPQAMSSWIKTFASSSVESLEIDLEKALKILNITESNLDRSLVDKSYKKLALIHHPDKGGDLNNFTEIKKAHQRLITQIDMIEKKKKYDIVQYWVIVTKLPGKSGIGLIVSEDKATKEVWVKEVLPSCEIQSISEDLVDKQIKKDDVLIAIRDESVVEMPLLRISQKLNDFRVPPNSPVKLVFKRSILKEGFVEDDFSINDKPAISSPIFSSLSSPPLSPQGTNSPFVSPILEEKENSEDEKEREIEKDLEFKEGNLPKKDNLDDDDDGDEIIISKKKERNFKESYEENKNKNSAKSIPTSSSSSYVFKPKLDLKQKENNSNTRSQPIPSSPSPSENSPSPSIHNTSQEEEFDDKNVVMVELSPQNSSSSSLNPSSTSIITSSPTSQSHSTLPSAAILEAQSQIETLSKENKSLLESLQNALDQISLRDSYVEEQLKKKEEFRKQLSLLENHRTLLNKEIRTNLVKNKINSEELTKIMNQILHLSSLIKKSLLSLTPLTYLYNNSSVLFNFSSTEIENYLNSNNLSIDNCLSTSSPTFNFYDIENDRNEEKSIEINEKIIYRLSILAGAAADLSGNIINKWLIEDKDPIKRIDKLKERLESKGLGLKPKLFSANNPSLSTSSSTLSSFSSFSPASSSSSSSPSNFTSTPSSLKNIKPTTSDRLDNTIPPRNSSISPTLNRPATLLEPKATSNHSYLSSLRSSYSVGTTNLSQSQSSLQNQPFKTLTRSQSSISRGPLSSSKGPGGFKK